MKTKNVLIVIIGIILIIVVAITTIAITTDNTTNNNTTEENITINNTTDDNNTTNTNKTSEKTSSSNSDNIPREGSYKGVDYSLHDGKYPYYSPQNEKVYNNRREEYNDMKSAIDSGIAD